MPFTFVAGPGTTGFNPIEPLVAMIPPPGQTVTGSIVGTIIDLIGGVVGGRSPASPALPPVPGSLQLPQLPQNGDFTLGGVIPANGTGCATAQCCPGKHPDKKTGTKCVSNRRMNPLNAKALRRATRRLKGFERAVKGTRKQLRTLAKI